MKVNFTSADALFSAETAVLPVFEGEGPTGAAAEFDARTSGALAKAAAAARMKGETGSLVEILAPNGVAANRVILIGVGERAKLDALGAEAFGGRAMGAVLTSGASVLTLGVSGAAGAGLGEAGFAASAAFGARLRGYAFDKYRTKLKEEQKPSVTAIDVATAASAEAASAYAPCGPIAQGVFFTRDLCSEPANVLHPAEFAKRCEELKSLGVKVEILGEKEMEKLGMGALLGVGQGSARESKLCVMRWEGAKGAPVALVGKGVCFDTGGISIKPAAGMEDMKWDMGGAAAVAGAIKALAGRKAKAHVVGVLGLVENMPDGNAQRPGDIVTSMSGQTIEVLNTDAEGRLVLADALTYVQRHHKPRIIVDLATLTGAILVSLAGEYAGMFSNDDDLAERLNAAGARVGEKLWRLPLGAAYDKQLDSPVADMKNIGGRWGGSITAAQFLQRFIEKDTPWAHLDVAGVVWDSEKGSPVAAKGATGFGARLLDRFIADHYEG